MLFEKRVSLRQVSKPTFFRFRMTLEGPKKRVKDLRRDWFSQTVLLQTPGCREGEATMRGIPLGVGSRGPVSHILECDNSSRPNVSPVYNAGPRARLSSAAPCLFSFSDSRGTRGVSDPQVRLRAGHHARDQLRLFGGQSALVSDQGSRPIRLSERTRYSTRLYFRLVSPVRADALCLFAGSAGRRGLRPLSSRHESECLPCAGLCVLSVSHGW